MITKDSLTKVGKVLKTHGTKGELNVFLEKGSAESFKYLIGEIDGLFVPFYVEWGRGNTSGRNLLKFEGVDNLAEAERLCGSALYIDTDMAEETADEELPLDFFLNYEIVDKDVVIGRICEFDCRTANVIAVVETDDGEEYYVPFNEDLIIDIDREQKQIFMDLPEGLFDM